MYVSVYVVFDICFIHGELYIECKKQRTYTGLLLENGLSVEQAVFHEKRNSHISRSQPLSPSSFERFPLTFQRSVIVKYMLRATGQKAMVFRKTTIYRFNEEGAFCMRT